MGNPSLSKGDWIIYRKQKVSSAPGPRAISTMPAPKGETYNYVVEKYWVVDSVLPDAKVRLVTRRGKVHDVAIDDPRMRKANWWEKWLLGSRFRAVEESSQTINSENTNSEVTRSGS